MKRWFVFGLVGMLLAPLAACGQAPDVQVSSTPQVSISWQQIASTPTPVGPVAVVQSSASCWDLAKGISVSTPSGIADGTVTVPGNRIGGYCLWEDRLPVSPTLSTPYSVSLPSAAFTATLYGVASPGPNGYTMLSDAAYVAAASNTIGEVTAQCSDGKTRTFVPAIINIVYPGGSSLDLNLMAKRPEEVPYFTVDPQLAVLGKVYPTIAAGLCDNLGQNAPVTMQ